MTVRANIEVRLGFDPGTVEFGNVVRGNEDTRTVKLIGRDAGKTKLLSSTFEPLPVFAQTLPVGADPVVRARLNADARTGTVEISVAPDAPLGRFAGHLVVHTDDTEVPDIKLRVQGVVRSDVTIRPERVIFRNVRSGVPQTQTLVVIGSEKRPVEVRKIESDNPALSVTASENIAGQTKLTVTYETEQPTRKVAKLVVHTSSADTPEIEVPVMIFPPSTASRPPTHRVPPTKRQD